MSKKRFGYFKRIYMYRKVNERIIQMPLKVNLPMNIQRGKHPVKSLGNMAIKREISFR
jgi:hypothetical protein